MCHKTCENTQKNNDSQKEKHKTNKTALKRIKRILSIEIKNNRESDRPLRHTAHDVPVVQSFHNVNHIDIPVLQSGQVQDGVI